MILDANLIEQNLQTRVIGKSIAYYDSVDSTNQTAWEIIDRGVFQNGQTILASHQREGRGRMGRTWFSPSEGAKSLICSVILQPDMNPSEFHLMTVIGALAVVDMLRSLAGIEALVKFPNDVYVQGRKISGILAESRLSESEGDIVVLGVGVNVNIEESEFPDSLQLTSTSMQREVGKEISLMSVARAFLESLDAWYGTMVKRDIRTIHQTWRSISFLNGHSVHVTMNDQVISGLVEDIDPLGGIVLRMADGSVNNIRGEHVERIERVRDPR